MPTARRRRECGDAAGVLETVAVYTVLRSKSLVDQTLPPEFSGNLLLTFGLLSFVVASLFILIQHNYKRLFAYSSIEHMGLAMNRLRGRRACRHIRRHFHLLNHALAKALAFFVAGNIHRRFETLEIEECEDSPVRSRLPLWRFSWPGALVITPLLPVRQRAPGSVGSGCAGLCVRYGACGAVYDNDDFERDAQPRHRHGASVLRRRLVRWIYVSRSGAMVWGAPSAGIPQGEPWTVGHVPLMIIIVALLGLGFILPEPIQTLLTRAVNVIVVR